jgi:Family of unknown function (DUF5681)
MTRAVDMTRTKPEASYNVGYGRPPPEHQFKKGEPSRNPKGRPRKQPLGINIAQLLNEKVPIKIDGRKKRVAFSEAFIQMQMANALKGDSKAAQLVLNLICKFGIAPAEPDNGLQCEHRHMLYKPEHDPLKDVLEAWTRTGSFRDADQKATH